MSSTGQAPDSRGSPSSSAPTPCLQRERGSTIGALVFGLVAACIVVFGYLWIDGRRARQQATAPTPHWRGTTDKWTGRLGKFLAKGPDGGTWESRFLSSVCQHYIRPHPTRDGVFQIARVGPDGPRDAQSVSRWLVPRHFFRAPSALFFSNYERSEEPMRETLPDGTDTWRVHWAPRAHPEGLTERRVWFTVDTGEVVQVEDHSRAGRMIRRVRRVSLGTGDWDPDAPGAEPLPSCEVAPPDPHADPEQMLLEAVDVAPFPVYAPTHVPAGFVLVRSSYTVCLATASTETLQNEPVPNVNAEASVHLVTQLYSDGMALISVAIAPPEDLDVIEATTGSMGDSTEPGTCPGLPADPREIRQDDSVVRMRTDVCRTVLRRDDLPGVSVSIIGRNELPAEEYLRMIGSLRQIESLSDEPDDEDQPADGRDG